MAQNKFSSTSQSGAMFGLDARIALAIFAAMAVVVGYLGFSRIELARQAALISELEAMENALAHYQTDLGTFYLFTLNKTEGDDDSTEDLSALWDISKVKAGFHNHWNGPYVHLESRKHPSYGNYSLFYAQGDRKNYCMTDTDCYVWLSLSKVPKDIWLQVNSYFDEGNGSQKEARGLSISSGKVQADADTDPRTLIFRTIMRPAS